MNKLTKNIAFKLGFLAGILFFVLANIFPALFNINSGICFDCYETYGFPFALYESGTVLHLNQFIWAGVVADISIAIISSLILGLVFKYIDQKFRYVYKPS